MDTITLILLLVGTLMIFSSIRDIRIIRESRDERGIGIHTPASGMGVLT